MKKYRMTLKNLDCANCAAKIETSLAKCPDMTNIAVNFNTSCLSYESESDQREIIIQKVHEIEPEVMVLDHNEEQTKVSHFDIVKFMVGVLCAGIAVFTPEPFHTAFLIIAYSILLSRTCMNALRLLWKSKAINENFLVFISCIGAYMVGEPTEGLMVIILYEIGKMLEDRAVHKTRNSIQSLMDIRPEYANLKENDHLVKVNPEAVKVGDTIVVKKGERIPLDGIVIVGNTSLDVKSLTGESKYQNVKIGENVLSGSVNISHVIEIKVTELYQNSTVSRILELVENATDKKAKTETFVSRAARIYTPLVVVFALLVAIFMPMIFEVSYQESIYKALTFLVISCPCAIAISVPLSYFSGIGASSRNGILVKGSDYLDSLRHIREIVFDKTGTLTSGNFEVGEIHVLDSHYREEEILHYMALGEQFSNHPIAQSILRSSKGPYEKIEDFEEAEGQGVRYRKDGKEYRVGNKAFVQFQGAEEIYTTVYLQCDQKVIGFVTLHDHVKEESKEMLQKLADMGIQTHMFTGDNREIANAIAEELQIDSVRGEMLPEDKFTALEQLLKTRKNGGRIAFVGDGVNDAPVLALADVGISMGGVGSASAIEASDVVIMNDDLHKIPQAIRISRFTSHIIKENLVFAIGVKVTVLLLSLFGIATMWEAIFADVGVTVITILNTLRILKR